MKTPILETPRLIFRPFSHDDAEDVFHGWENDPDVARYMFWTSHNDINLTKAWLSFETEKILADDWFRWGLVEKETDRLIGTGLIYYEKEFKMFEVGYNLGKQFWGKGFATEAMSEILRFARENLKLKEIVGRYATENPRSEHVMEKLGFKYFEDCNYPCNNGAIMLEGKVLRLTFWDEGMKIG
ncbi:GNAT family N-acetyltransferase [Acetobacterium paludosum]|uniref:GNAT family N-acetyltransferase n=1 Tax=Acetobacterium paludosum TaxID=52693 RepID=A0A923HUD9_9FIRM|nr:GNAT family N-acetyltransferase [Acetobacterium paludosum]MBC3887425.1 GNAT family N-acetyltransferase [Acetobacterium paludosum]